MNTDQSAAKQAIQHAYQALQSGDRSAARRWAEQAVTLGPNLEEPWLLLAAVSPLQARLKYLQQALQINPQSVRARAGIEQTRQKLQAEEGLRVGTKTRARHTAIWLTVLALTLTAAVIWSGVSSAQTILAPTPEGERPSWSRVEVSKPTYTPSPIPTATPIPTPTPVPTEMLEMAAPALSSESEPSAYIDGASYIVQRGDTLGEIAARFGVSIEMLVEANRLADPSSIYAGQELIIPGVAFIPPQPGRAGGPKHILVDISEQHLYAYEGDDLVYSFVASTGMNNATATGTFQVLNKLPSAYGSTWNIWMPYWLGIYWSGGLQNGIHALPILPGGGRLWSGYLGRPISYGCIVLGEYEAKLLYEWAEIGTPVVIEW
jgi:LysM repeat protein